MLKMKRSELVKFSSDDLKNKVLSRIEDREVNKLTRMITGLMWLRTDRTERSDGKKRGRIRIEVSL